MRKTSRRRSRLGDWTRSWPPPRRRAKGAANPARTARTKRGARSSDLTPFRWTSTCGRRPRLPRTPSPSLEVNGPAPDRDGSIGATAPGIPNRHGDAHASHAGHDRERDESDHREEDRDLARSLHDSSPPQNGYCWRAIAAPRGSVTTATLPLRVSSRGANTTVPPRDFAFSDAASAFSTR